MSLYGGFGDGAMMPSISGYSDRLNRLEGELMRMQTQTPSAVRFVPPGTPSKEHQDLIIAYNQLLKAHTDLIKINAEAMGGSIPMPLKPASNGMGSPSPAGPQSKKKTAGMYNQPTLGVIRLDYDYPPAPGDIDHPGSFGYDVFYRVVPGLTFSMCQSGKLTRSVEEAFIDAIGWLDNKGVKVMTGDCGFMMYFQKLARRRTVRAVAMSSLAQLPAVTCAYAATEKIAIFTANGKTLAPMRDLIRDECGVDPEERRYVIVGCEDVPGFEAVAAGDKVNVAKVTPGMVAKARKTLQMHPEVRAFLFECTELPPYSDAVRAATGLPVYDSITACDFFMTGFQDNPRFGLNDWQKDWDGQQADYKFGANLTGVERARLVNKPT